MNMPAFSLCALLASCSPAPPPELPPVSVADEPALPAPVSPEPANPDPAKPDPAKPAATTTVAKAYQKAAQKEIPAVIAPNATPERVRSVHSADVAARRAVSRLEAQGRHPTQAALDAARSAVKQLSDVLNSPTE
jgi:hypothetical protein